MGTHGSRQLALEAYEDGFNPGTVRNEYGSWFDFVATVGDLTPAEAEVRSHTGAFLGQLLGHAHDPELQDAGAPGHGLPLQEFFVGLGSTHSTIRAPSSIHDLRPPARCGCDRRGSSRTGFQSILLSTILMGEEHVEFVRTATYESGIAGFLSPEAEAEFVERELLVNPRRGVVMRGTGGFRKLRVPLEGRGKRGGGRVVYYYVARRDRVFLVAFFPKNVKPNLTAAERAALRRLARELEQSE